jgi:hypothetical protein
MVLLIIAGAALLLPVEWVVHIGSGTTETRAVIAHSRIDGDFGYRGNVSYEAVAVAADGQGIDLAAAGGLPLVRELSLGDPVIITRSAADDRILEVRGPLTTVNVENSGVVVFLRVFCIGVAAVGIWLGVRGVPRRWWLVSALAVGLGLLLCYGLLPRQHDIGPYQGSIPDAMNGYADPPTAAPVDLPSRRVHTVVPIGTRVESGTASHVTVTGPPEPGLPPGADPQVGAGFTTLRVPLLAEPRADSGQYVGMDSLPSMDLIGDGLGRATPLDLSPRCGGSPEGFPRGIAAPRRGYACFVVPDGFVPRYLVFVNDDVAVDLWGAPNLAGQVVVPR